MIRMLQAVFAGALLMIAGSAWAGQKMDIVDTAAAAGNFGTLVKAVQAAGLVDTLKGDGPFTVFAPTDEAFAKIAAAQLTALLADKQALAKVLTYHVVSGKLLASEVAGQSTLPTAQGGELMVDTDGDRVMINEARVITTDIETRNGVIHVIDSVLMPPA